MFNKGFQSSAEIIFIELVFLIDLIASAPSKWRKGLLLKALFPYSQFRFPFLKLCCRKVALTFHREKGAFLTLQPIFVGGRG